MHQIYLNQPKRQVWIVIYASQAHSQRNIVVSKIKPKTVCLMASDKRACAQLSQACACVNTRFHHLHLSSLQIIWGTGLWVLLLKNGSERVWKLSMFCVQFVFPLLKRLGDSTQISLHDSMPDRYTLNFVLGVGIGIMEYFWVISIAYTNMSQKNRSQ
jgi:hypothetical protein